MSNLPRLPFTNFIGPGNTNEDLETLNPIDRADAIAKWHDKTYEKGLLSDQEVFDSDNHAISDFLSVFAENSNIQESANSLIGAAGLAVKSAIEQKTGVLYGRKMPNWNRVTDPVPKPNQINGDYILDWYIYNICTFVLIATIYFMFHFFLENDSGIATQINRTPPEELSEDEDMIPAGQGSPVLQARKRLRPNSPMQSGPGATVSTSAADASIGIHSHAAGTDSQFGPEPYMPKTHTKWLDNDTIEFQTTHIVYQRNFNSKWVDVSEWVQPYPKSDSTYKPLAKVFPLFDLEWGQLKRYMPKTMFRTLQSIGSGKFTKCGVSVKLCSISQAFETNSTQTEKVQQGKMRYIGVCKGPEALHNTFNSCNVSIDDDGLVQKIQLPIVNDDGYYLWGEVEANGDKLDGVGAVPMGQPQQYPNYLTAIRQVKKEPLYNYMSAIDMFNANNVIMKTYLDEQYEFKDSRTGPFKPRMTDNPPRDHSKFIKVANGKKSIERQSVNIFTKPIHTRKKVPGSLINEDQLSDEEDGLINSRFMEADSWMSTEDTKAHEWLHASKITTEEMYDLPLEKAGLFVDGDLNINPPGEAHQPKLYTGLMPVMKITPVDPWNNRSSTMDNEIVEDMIAHFIVTYKIQFKFDPLCHDAHNLCQYLTPHTKLGPSTNVFLMTRYNIKGYLDKEYNMGYGRTERTNFDNRLYFMRGRQHDFIYGTKNMLLSRPQLNDVIRAVPTRSVPARANRADNVRHRDGYGTEGAPDTIYNTIVANEERDIESRRTETVTLTRD